ncbi:TPA: hypothetical protein N2O04_002929 [Citrobacter freundii]|nr:hypothetical protein [Citrobacter freundii]
MFLEKEKTPFQVRFLVFSSKTGKIDSPVKYLSGRSHFLHVSGEYNGNLVIELLISICTGTFIKPFYFNQAVCQSLYDMAENYVSGHF